MSKRKLLLADDSVTIQKVVNLTFADEGIEVIVSADGDAAMEKFAEFAPDLVLADVNMPGLNGYQVCEKIKQNEQTRKTPVILLVGSFEPFNEEEARRVGADDFLTKPFQSIRQLVNKVFDLLDRNDKEVSGEMISTTADENAKITSVVSSESFNSNLKETGTDDEMIQTNQIESAPVKETAIFDADFTNETFKDDFAQNESEKNFESDFKDLGAYEFEDSHSAQTQPLTVQDFSEITTGAAEKQLPEKKVYDLADERFPPQEKSETKTPAEKSPIDLDETNLLEIPLRENLFPASNFPPELIDAVARKVIEKLSDKAVREIAREVVPQLADSIIRQMAEEKLKQ